MLQLQAMRERRRRRAVHIWVKKEEELKENMRKTVTSVRERPIRPFPPFSLCRDNKKKKKKKNPSLNSATPHEALHCSQKDENAILDLG
jgi:hypothetical protein